MRPLAQTLAVTALNLRSLGQRAGSSAVAVVGFAGVVAVFVAVLSIAEGVRQVMERGTSPDTVLVLRAGSDTEMSSGLSLEETRVIKDAPGLVHGPAGTIASAELYVVVNVPKRTTGTDANVPLRGVEPAAFGVRPSVRIVEGRRFREGSNEVIVGRAAAHQFSGLDVGARLRWGENVWQVVGVFDADGSIYESEIWTDVRVLQPAYRRTGFQSVYARLEAPEAFARFEAALGADPRLHATVMREDAYYAAQSKVLRTLVRVLGNTVALLMAVGATFGALNTMYSAVAARGREIATLRAIGFQGSPVLVSVMTESLVLALVGGALGGGLAYAVANGYETATLNFQSFSQVAFRLTVTPRLLAGGVAYALAMGFLGGIFPAIRAVRMPVAFGLREP
ncbi:MAG TPA: ABC transporter permease [Candidatus Binatia bacterium]|nr:ABC transporter permease [Candidatus Binatia bacterium]